MTNTLGESSFGEEARWTFTETDGEYEIAKWVGENKTSLFTGTDKASAITYWNTLNEEIVGPTFTP